jgi:hypothetical protein
MTSKWSSSSPRRRKHLWIACFAPSDVETFWPLFSAIICRRRSRRERNSSETRIEITGYCEAVLQAFRLWRENTAYRSDEDWILPARIITARLPTPTRFFSVVTSAPVIEKISGIKSSKEAPNRMAYATPVASDIADLKRENVKVAQSQLRHTTPKITLELYAQAVSVDQQEAHKKVVQMVLPARFSEKLKRGALPQPRRS